LSVAGITISQTDLYNVRRAFDELTNAVAALREELAERPLALDDGSRSATQGDPMEKPNRQYGLDVCDGGYGRREHDATDDSDGFVWRADHIERK
jgi:hypothetical protein